MKVENIRQIPGTFNGYYAVVDGVSVRIIAREGQDPLDAVMELFKAN